MYFTKACYIDDVSNLYQFTWFENYKNSLAHHIANFHAVFDETRPIKEKSFLTPGCRFLKVF